MADFYRDRYRSDVTTITDHSKVSRGPVWFCKCQWINPEEVVQCSRCLSSRSISVLREDRNSEEWKWYREASIIIGQTRDRLLRYLQRDGDQMNVFLIIFDDWKAIDPFFERISLFGPCAVPLLHYLAIEYARPDLAWRILEIHECKDLCFFASSGTNGCDLLTSIELAVPCFKDASAVAIGAARLPSTLTYPAPIFSTLLTLSERNPRTRPRKQPAAYQNQVDYGSAYTTWFKFVHSVLIEAQLSSGATKPDSKILKDQKDLLAKDGKKEDSANAKKEETPKGKKEDAPKGKKEDGQPVKKEAIINSGPTSNVSVDNNKWACTSCTYENLLNSVNCQVCSAARVLIPTHSTASNKAATDPMSVLREFLGGSVPSEIASHFTAPSGEPLSPFSLPAQAPKVGPQLINSGAGPTLHEVDLQRPPPSNVQQPPLQLQRALSTDAAQLQRLISSGSDSSESMTTPPPHTPPDFAIPLPGYIPCPHCAIGAMPFSEMAIHIATVHAVKEEGVLSPSTRQSQKWH